MINNDFGGQTLKFNVQHAVEPKSVVISSFSSANISIRVVHTGRAVR